MADKKFSISRVTINIRGGTQHCRREWEKGSRPEEFDKMFVFQDLCNIL